MLLRRLIASLLVVAPTACASSTTVACTAIGIAGSIGVDLSALPRARTAVGSLDNAPLHLVRTGDVLDIYGRDTQTAARVQLDLRLLDRRGQRIGGGTLQVRMHEKTFGSGPCALHARSARLVAAADGTLRQTG